MKFWKNHKHSIVGAFSVLVAGILAISISGCQLTEAQMKVIADNAGLVAAVTWIGVDNPIPEVKQQVSGICTVIKDKAGLVKEGKTYMEVLNPLLEQYIEDNVEARYRPLCKVGSGQLLSGIDLMFALNPEWLKQQDLATSLVVSFCNGAVRGLSLTADHPVMKAALSNNAVRMKQFKK